MRSFFSSHIVLGVGKQQDLKNAFCQTVGDGQQQITIFPQLFSVSDSINNIRE
jgi:hypothetical protein